MSLPDADAELVTAIRRSLHDAADRDRAVGMQRYMKSEMPCLGVSVPGVRAIVRTYAHQRPPSSTEVLRDTALALWRPAEFREERYAATALTGVPTARKLQRAELVELYQEMITTGAWWDHVDELAQRVGYLLLTHPAQVRPVIAAWTRADDRWLRRASVICQIKAKDRTDLALLVEAVEANVADPDFFLRKAIGWALRSYAYTDPDWVRRFVERHDALSPLSRREALKHLV